LLGKSVIPVIDMLREWGEEYRSVFVKWLEFSSFRTKFLQPASIFYFYFWVFAIE
jgi:hypothetical protein